MKDSALNNSYGGTVIFFSRSLHLLAIYSLLQCLLLFFVFTNSRGANSVPKAADLVADNQPIDLSSERYQHLFVDLEEQHQFTRAQLLELFKGITVHRKVLQLMDKQWEAKPYYLYWPLFITPSVINTGRKKLSKYRPLFDRIEAEYGVDRAFIVAIWGIESRFGSNQGGFELFRTLNTLFDAYPRRSDFFRKELIHFLVLCRANNIDPMSVKGSYAGAFGQAQFMPSSFIEYAVDFDGDGRRDLIHSKEDIFASIANYLSKFGWTLHAPVYIEIGKTLNSEQLVDAYKKGRKGRADWRLVAEAQQLAIPRPPENSQLSIVGLERSKQDGGGLRYVAGYPNFQAITEYNHSNKYAMAVSEMAEAFTKR